MSQAQEQEINFFELFQTLWKGKWTIIIITIFFGTLGVFYSISRPNFYEVKTIIDKGDQSKFLKFKPINQLLEDNSLSLNEYNPAGYLINADRVFELFLNEFNDYEELISILSKNEYIKEQIKDLNKKDKTKALIRHAKLFKISKPSKKKEGTERYISFKWHDVDEGTKLLNDTLILTLSNVNSIIYGDINNLATSIEMKTKRDIENFKINISQIEERQNLLDVKRLRYLMEHSEIARELNIKTNMLGVNGLKENTQNRTFHQDNINNQMIYTLPKSISPNNNLINFPYYLRGFSAIDKEISLIKSRTKEEKLLMNDDYIILKTKMFKLRNDGPQLRNAAKIILSDDYSKWVDFDLLLADIQLLKNSFLYVLFSLMLGGTIGILYVLIRKRLLEYK